NIDLHVSGPADRYHQQRDDRISRAARQARGEAIRNENTSETSREGCGPQRDALERRDREADPTDEEGDTAERRDRAKRADPTQRERVQTAGEQHDSGHETPAGD